MTKSPNLRMAVLMAAALVWISSCTYDPYYSGSSVSGSYASSGYGYGYGYGGSSFTTSVFVGTGNPRWGYDPYTYAYYDYHRRCYYDPYLNGYYPLGYRPPVVYGVPHPHGWRPGRGYCPPPSVVNNYTVVNYRNREAAYRNSRHDWARNVRQQHNGQRPGYAPDRRDQRPAAKPDRRDRANGYPNRWVDERNRNNTARRPAYNGAQGPANRGDWQSRASNQPVRPRPSASGDSYRGLRNDNIRTPRQQDRRASKPQNQRPQPASPQPRGNGGGQNRRSQPERPANSSPDEGKSPWQQGRGGVRSLGQG